MFCFEPLELVFLTFFSVRQKDAVFFFKNFYRRDLQTENQLTTALV